MNRYFVKCLLLCFFAAEAHAQLLSCGQTNECISIVGELHKESPLFSSGSKFERFVAPERFHLITDGRSWRIRIPEGNDSQVIEREYATDGQAFYCVSAYNTNYSGPIQVSTKSGLITTNAVPGRSRNNASAKLFPGAMPSEVSTVMNLWLVYFSGCELKKREAASHYELPPYYSGAVSQLGYSEPVRWKLSDGFPYCPKRLEFFGGGIYGWSPENGMSRRVPPSPFTNMNLFVDKMTNFGSWTIPVSFKFTSYQSPDGTNDAPRVVLTVRGETTEIVRIPHPGSFLPTVYPATSVDDRRFDPEQPKSYYISERWLTPEEAKNEWRRQRMGGR
jgi:hypothetical protein